MVDNLSMALNLLRNRQANFTREEEKDERYLEFEDDYSEMLYHMTGRRVNEEMFNWRDFN